MDKNGQTNKKDEELKEETESTQETHSDTSGQAKGTEERIEVLGREVEELKNDYKRALADYQNLQKRTREERSEWIKAANKELVLRLLPVLDTMILAQKHLKDQGLELSIRQFLDLLKQEGIEKIETVGKKFDPLLMECIDIVEDPSAGFHSDESSERAGRDAEEKVLDEIRAGYTMFEKVIRPAQVRVGKGKSS